MKKRIALLAVACMMFASMGIFAACGGQTPPPSGDLGQGTTHTHNYGDWIIGKKPTTTEKGSAKRTCTANDDGIETKELPVLTDSFWTKDETASKAPTHTAAGKDVYKNAEYGLTVEVELPADADAHTYGAWSWKNDVKPTHDSGATAQRTCTDSACGHVDELPVPDLDDAFWTKDETASEAPTHTAAGKNVYKNAANGLSVEEDVAATGHTWGAWTWKDDVVPTSTTGATIVHTCTEDDGGAEEFDVKALTDTSEWTAGTPTAADYNNPGTTTYTHKTHANLTFVAETEAKKSVVYDNKDYYSFHVQTESKFRNRAVSDWGSWTTQDLQLDGNVGVGEGSPFTKDSKIVFWLVNHETGEMQIRFYAYIDTNDDNERDAYDTNYTSNIAYVDMASGIIVMSHNAGTDFGSNIDVLTPYGQYTAGQSKASVWSIGLDFGAVITYKYTPAGGQETSLTMYVTGNQVYFGVEVKDLDGNAVAAENAYHAEQLFITKGSETLASIGYKAATEGGSMVELDEYVGKYTGSEGELLLDGKGGVKLTKDQKVYTGAYEPETAENTVGVTYHDGTRDRHFTATLNKTEKSYTAELEEVVVTYHVNATEGYTGNAAATAPTEVTTDKGAPVELDATFSATEKVGEYFFRGWYTDAACTDAVKLNGEGKLVPQADVDLYAKWAKAIVIKTKNEYAEPDGIAAEKTQEVSHDVAVGDKILDALNGYIENLFDEETGHVFSAWYTGEESNKSYLGSAQAAAQFGDGNANMVFHAEWKYAPYIGEYSGNEITNVDSVGYSMTLTIGTDLTVTVTGRSEVTVLDGCKVPDNGYDKASQTLTLQGSDKTYTLYIDIDSGVLAFKVEGGDLNGSYHVLSKYGCDGTHFGITTASGVWGAQFVLATMKDESEKIVFIHNNKIYADATIANGFGDALTTLDNIKNSKTVVVTSGADTLLARASEGDSFAANSSTVALDGNQGVYTLDSDVALKLDGAGDAMLGEHTGSYEATAENNKFDVYVTEGDTLVYYEVTLTKGEQNTYTKTKVMIELIFNYGDVSEPTGKLESTSFNKNIEFALPNLVDPAGTYLFRGWFTDAAFEDECASETPDNVKTWTYTPTAEGVTLYAKWVQKVTINMHRNDNDETVDVVTEYGLNEEIVLERITRDAWVFAGWFTDDEEFTQAWGKFDPATGNTTVTLTELTYTIYAKWIQPPVYYGVYRLYYYDGAKENGSTDNGDLSKDVFIDESGKLAGVSGATWPFSSAMSIGEGDFDQETGKVKFTRGSSSNDAYFELSTKIIVFIARGTNPQGYDDMFVLVPVAMAEGATVTGAQWEEGTIRVINIHTEESDYGIYLKNDEDPHFGVSYVDGNGEAVTDLSNAYTTITLRIMSGKTLIASYGYNGTTMVALDGNEGSYTLSGSTIDELPNTLTLDGISAATFGEDTVGSYEVVSDNVVGIYVNGAYYEATLDKDAGTYTLTKPTVSVIFDSEKGLAYGDNQTLQNGEYNKNIEAKLPVLNNTETHVFRGWYTTNDFQEDSKIDPDNGKPFIPSGDEAITLYAKWLEKVTVKVHYQKAGVKDVTLELGKGEEAKPVEPGYTDGQVFKAWHLGTAEGDVWAWGTEVEDNIEIYCEWQDAVVLFGSWSGRNVYGDSSGNGASDKTLDVTAVGAASGAFSSTFQSYDFATGRVIFASGNSYYYGSYDEKNGILIVNYNSSTNVEFIINSDINVYLKHSFTVSNSWAINNSNANRVFTIDGTNNVFVYEGRVYGNVSFKNAESMGMEITALKDSSAFSVYNSEGQKIINFIKSGSGWESTDGLEGTYTGDKGEEARQDLILDGKGSVTWAGRQGTYSLQDGVENGIEIYLEASGDKAAEYWTVVVDKSGQSYTATMPMVQLTLILRNEAGAETLETVQKSVNKNIPVALSATHDDLVSAGWYTDETLQEAVTLDANGLFKPTEETTLYAQMVAKVTLTIVYGTEHGNLGTVTVDLPKNSTPDLTGYVPEKQGTYVFGGWYEDEACTETPYTPAPLTESKTIYCKWIEQQYDVTTVASGDTEWTEVDGTWSLSCSKDSIKALIEITFSAAGTFSYDWTASFEDNMADGLYIAIRNPDKPTELPHGQGDKVHSTGKGTDQYTVKAGDILVFEFYTDNSDHGDPDSATVSNFSFVAD